MSSFEQKFCIGTNDGKYQIFWDITALINDLQNKNFPVYQKNIFDLIERNNFYGNPDYAMQTNVTMPCIIVELDGKTEKLIDGNHRLYKASQLNFKSIPCYILPEEYHKKFIMDYDDLTYTKVVSEIIKPYPPSLKPPSVLP